MPELVIAPDPALWHVVPARDDAEPWARGLIEGLDAECTRDVVIAAELALLTREAAQDGVVLLLSEPSIGLYAALTVLVTAAPGIDDAQRAEQLALNISGSQWPPTTTRFTVGGLPGWRISTLEADSDVSSDPTVDVVSTTRTTYVLTVAGRLGVAQLSPLPPTAAALVMPLVEDLLPSIEVHDG